MPSTAWALARPGIIYRTAWHVIAECARCGHPRKIHGRGLCQLCHRIVGWDGRLDEYGGKVANMRVYARGRAAGLRVAGAAANAEITERTGWRYETEIRRALTVVLLTVYGAV